MLVNGSRGPAWRVVRGGVASCLGWVAAVGLLRAQHAVSVLQYDPGVGYATEFGTGVGYTNAVAILGEPSRVTGGPFGGTVDPFSPPWQPGQVVSLGAGGSIEVMLDSPVRRDPAHPFGIDLLLFGASGFVIVNGDYSGGGVTDGGLFGQEASVVRVSVATTTGPWLTLDPALAPVLEGLFPTDGTGEFTRAVNPALKPADFSGLGLEAIRLAYAGSGGGTGYSLDWARDGSGQPVAVDEAMRVRVEVLSGRVELDAVSAVRPVPEPGAWALGWGGVLAMGAWTWRTGSRRRTEGGNGLGNR